MTAKPAGAAARGRKPMKSQPLRTVELNEEAFAEVDANTALMHATTASYGAERDLLNQVLGQTQMSKAFAEFSLTVMTSKMAFVKESKAYKSIVGMKSPNGKELSGTWEEFCGLLGMSVAKADADIANLRAFGAEALESMSRMGIGYRDLRQYRQLSADDQTALAEIAKTGDKDAVLDVAEQLIARQQAEREKLRDQLEKKSKEYESLSERQARLAVSLDEAQAKAALLPRMKVDDKAAAMFKELDGRLAEARAALRKVEQGAAAFLEYVVEHDIEAYDIDLVAHAKELANPLLALLTQLHVSGLSEPKAHAVSVLKGAN